MKIFDITIDFNNAVTLIIIAIIAFFAVLGLFKGFMRSIIALICLGASIGLAIALMNPFLDLLYSAFRLDLEGVFIDLLENESLNSLQGLFENADANIPLIAAQIVSCIILFIVFQIIFGIIASILYNVIGTIKPTLTDSLIGMVLFGVIGFAVVTLVLGFASIIPVDGIKVAIESSSLATALQELALKILPLG